MSENKKKIRRKDDGPEIGGYFIRRRESREETGIYFEMETVVYHDVVSASSGKTVMRFTDYDSFGMKVELDPDGCHVWVTDGGKKTRHGIKNTFDPKGHYAQGASAEDWNRDD